MPNRFDTNHARQRALEQIAEGQKMLEELDALDARLTPLLNRVLGNIQYIESSSRLKVVTVTFDQRLYNWLLNMSDGDMPTSIGTAKTDVNPSDKYFDCYSLGLEDGTERIYGLSRELLPRKYGGISGLPSWVPDEIDYESAKAIRAHIVSQHMDLFPGRNLDI